VRILIVGAGAVGGYFGGRLIEAGRDVTFLVRQRRAGQLRADGLRLTSPQGETRTVSAKVALASHIGATFDAVLVSVKAYDLDEAIEDFAPAVDAETMVVPFLNGMRHVGALVGRFGEERVLGGVCLVSTKLEADGRIVQLTDTQSLTYGERGGGRSERVASLDEALRDAGFEAAVSENIVQAMWEKWVALATLGGITCLMRGTVGEIAAVPGGADLTRQLLDECTAVAAAAGFPPSQDYNVRTLALLTMAGSGLASSMYRDLIAGNRVEADQILGDMLERARHLRVDTPVLAIAFANVSLYQNRLKRA
jgi:2-dehydropantoate 2-reductase